MKNTTDNRRARFRSDKKFSSVSRSLTRLALWFLVTDVVYSIDCEVLRSRHVPFEKRYCIRLDSLVPVNILKVSNWNAKLKPFWRALTMKQLQARAQFSGLCSTPTYCFNGLVWIARPCLLLLQIFQTHLLGFKHDFLRFLAGFFLFFYFIFIEILHIPSFSLYFLWLLCTWIPHGLMGGARQQQSGLGFW